MNTDWWDRHNEGQYPFGTFHSAPTGGMYSWQCPDSTNSFLRSLIGGNTS